ncbi:MAG: NAD(P)H-hydrate dehydratase [Bacteroidetes bacterium]|nr:NAD(P)H-hydrate dehydratase [Bacteroidota bacterium]MCL5026831.1 NAD(P)H-hydrate dehydratase [Chloroflexota bacterium]
MKVVTAAQMRWVEEQSTALGMPGPALMQNAGRAVADAMQRAAGSLAGKRVLVLVGPGNNGGDGLVAARHLADMRASVTCYLWGRQQDLDPNLLLVQQRGLLVLHADRDPQLERLRAQAETCDFVLDALLGTGKARPIEGQLKAILDVARAARGAQIVALDLPTGLDPDTGRTDPACLAAHTTVALGYPKLGLLLFPGAGYVGRLVVADIGLAGEGPDTRVQMVTQPEIAALLPARPPDANKGTFGKVLVVAGSMNLTGAPFLTAMGAARVGAGLVTLATAKSIHPIVAASAHETTFLPLPEAEPGVLGEAAAEKMLGALDAYDTLVVGPGLGQHPATIDFVLRLVEEMPEDAPSHGWVLDADALNCLSQHRERLERIPGKAVLTPHPGEMGRLLDTSVSDVVSRRLEVAQGAAAAWRQVVVLKGAHTLVAAPDGQVSINPVANPGLATAGTGDVLAGAIAGLLAQGLDPYSAARCGVHLHSLAADILTQERGDAGLIAGDLLGTLPRAIRQTTAAGKGPGLMLVPTP